MDAPTFFQTASSVVVAASALVTGTVAIATLRQSASDSRERTRPMVVSYFQGAEHNFNAIELVVINLGQTVAHNVRVTFSPPLPPLEETDDLTGYLSRRYSAEIPTLVPQLPLRNLWWSGRATGGHVLRNALSTPDEVTVHVSYSGLGGTRYEDTYPLNIEAVSLTTYSVSSESPLGRWASIAKSLEKISARLHR